MLLLNTNIINSIKKHAIVESPNECCGLIYASGDSNYTFPSVNISQNKFNSFSISPFDYINASEQGKIVGFYHSHCGNNGEFGHLDKYNSLNHKLPLVLYHIKSDNFKIYNDKDEKFSKYLGIKFEYGKNDCFSLVESFYNNEFNINLPNISRDKNWHNKNPLLIKENIENFGFKIVSNLEYGDVVLVSLPNNQNPRHLMIYLGDNKVLHNSFNSYSVIENYSEQMKKQTISIIRHKSLWN